MTNDGRPNTPRRHLPYVVAGCVIGILAGVALSVAVRWVWGRVLDSTYGTADDVNRRFTEASGGLVIGAVCLVVGVVAGGLIGARWGRGAAPSP